MTDYMGEVVTRSAPRWAWELIDGTLHLDALSSAFDEETRKTIRDAIDAMMWSCEQPDLDPITQDMVRARRKFEGEN